MPRILSRAALCCLLALLPVASALAANAVERRPSYRGNAESRVFHVPTCRHFTCKNCVVTFDSRDEALKAGYRPCGVCRP